MAIAVAATRNALVTEYISLGTWIGLATGDPGTSATPSNEATGGSPAYARKQTTWGSVSSSASTGTAVTIDVAAGTYTHALLASSSSGNNMIDKCDITDTVLSAQGQIIVTATYTQA